MKDLSTHAKRCCIYIKSRKTTLFNCFAYNYSNNENNISIFNFIFRFNHQFANERQYLIFLRRECNNTTSINNRL